MSGCVFCDLSKVAGVEWCADQAGTQIWRFPPLNPVVEGHMLFVPSRHVADATDDPMVTAAVFEMAAWYARSRRLEANILTSVGRAATQSVFHLHVHVVPRAENDGLSLPWTPQQLKGN